MKIPAVIQSGAVAVVVAGCLLASLLVPLGGRNDDGIEESIALAVRKTRDGGSAPLDWRPLSFLAYDRLVVMDGYATGDDLRRRLGFPWSGADKAALGGSDDEVVLVFETGRRVVAWAHVDRDEADFACLTGMRLLRREALLVVQRRPRGRAQVFVEDLPRRYRRRPGCILP